MSANKEHGISVGISRINNVFFMKMTINGTLTHDDYKCMIPVVNSAIKGIKKPKINILVDAINFEGWEIRALWDDFKFSLDYSSLFDKIAFVGNKKWEEYAVKIANWFMLTDIEYFENIQDATHWIKNEN